MMPDAGWGYEWGRESYGNYEQYKDTVSVLSEITLSVLSSLLVCLSQYEKYKGTVSWVK